MPEILTIGVYGWDAERFFQALQDARVDTFCDIRARRGVRGSEYAFANSKRLQDRLAGLGIRYVHRPDLAPSIETRQQQWAEDEATHTGKRSRTTLAPAFVEHYEQERLRGFDGRQFIADLGEGANRILLFCIEGLPTACHRSLLANRLARDLGLSVTHLTPPER